MTVCLKYLLVIVSLFSILPDIYPADNIRVDSLLALLDDSKADTGRVCLLIDIADEIIRNDPENALFYAEKAISLSKKLRSKRGLAESLTMQGSCYYQLSKFENAAQCFSSAKEIYNQINDPEGVAISCNNLGGIRLKLGYFKESLGEYITAAMIFEDIDDKYGAATIYNNLAIICKRQHKLDESVNYYSRALKLAKNMNDTELTAGILHNMGSLCFEQNRITEALGYIREAYELRNRINDIYGMAQSARGLGTVYMALKEETEALKYFLSATEMYDKTEDLHGKAECLSRIAVLQYRQKNFRQSRNTFEKSYKIGNKLGSLTIQQFAAGWISDIDSVTGNLASALYYYKMYKLLSDSILTDAKNHEMNEMRLTYEKEKLEKESRVKLLDLSNSLKESRLKKTKYLIFSLIFGSLLIFILGLLLFQRNRIKVQRKIFELELDKLRQQLEPHFLFNSLNSLQSLVYEGDRITLNDCLGKLSKLMRLMLDCTQERSVTLRKEIEFLSIYLDLMRMRYKDRFNYTIAISDNLDVENFRIPPLIIQPFVENSVYHGLRNKKGKGFIHIEFNIRNENLHCKIEDNGIGRISALEAKEHNGLALKQSYSTKINESRLRLLNSIYGKELGIKFIDLTDNFNNPAGTRVELDLPILLN